MPRKRKTPKDAAAPGPSGPAQAGSAAAAATRPTAPSTAAPQATTPARAPAAEAPASAAASAAAWQTAVAPAIQPPVQRQSPERTAGAQGSGEGSGSGSPEGSPQGAAQQIEVAPPEASDIGHILVPEQCRRPDRGGQLGSPLQVVTNMYLLKVQPKDIYQYDVQIEELRAKRDPKGKGKATVEQVTQELERVRLDRDLPPRLCRAILRKLAEDSKWDPVWAYDGKKTLYFARRGVVPQTENSTEVVVESDSGRSKRFVVTTKEVAVVDLKWLLKENLQKETSAILQSRDSFQAAEIILKHSAAMYRDFVMSGNARAFFVKPLEHPDANRFPGGAELWTGYRQSLRPTSGGLAINVDVATAAFVKEGQNCVQYMLAVTNKRSVAELQQRYLRRELKDAFYGLKVKTPHNNITYTIKNVLETGANVERVPGHRETIAVYFQNAHGITLQHPSAPLLMAGTTQNPKYLPPELCIIKKGNRVTKLSDQQTQQMPRLASLKPHVRFDNIQRSILPASGLAQDPTARAFGLTMDTKRCEPRGRVLPPPIVVVRDMQNAVKNVQVTAQGKWIDPNIEFKYIKGGLITSFGVASFVSPDNCNGEPHLKAFIEATLAYLKKRGVEIRVQGVPPIAWYRGRGADQDKVTDTMKEAVQKGQKAFGVRPHIIFALLGPRKNMFYKEVKTASDSELGIVSQCFLTKALGLDSRGGGGGGFDKAYLENLCLKINAKVGGVNQDVKLDAGQAEIHAHCNVIRQGTLFLGADVTHPGPRSPDPSIAAVIASTNATATRFAAKILKQTARVENIVGMKRAVKELLRVRKNLNPTSRLPDRIVMYRDGVSEGQFEMVRDKEYRAIRAACTEFDNQYRPFITIIAVQKRHLTSLGAALKTSLDNVPPGTVVDALVTHPVDFDWFMASQSGLQGTTRAAKYTTIANECNFDSENTNGMTSDRLQLLTYRMSYLFCRCRTPVSLPPPAYYAHLAAARGKALLYTVDSGQSETSTSMAEVDMAEIHRDLDEVMFFV